MHYMILIGIVKMEVLSREIENMSLLFFKCSAKHIKFCETLLRIKKVYLLTIMNNYTNKIL